ncbi:MAG: hypothetical protein K2Q33_08340, partial [Gammaproteobacteria bacterium]|nr:hypothetical protein [Gammaproteobacteria bacterium]
MKRKQEESPDLPAKRYKTSSEEKNTSDIPQLIRKRTPYSFLTCLNDLAWLFESETASCSSVCLINQRFLISDNLFCQEIREDLKGKDTLKIAHVKRILKYLSHIITEKNPSERKRQLFMKELCLQKFKGEEKGSVAQSFNPDELDQ